MNGEEGEEKHQRRQNLWRSIQWTQGEDKWTTVSVCSNPKTNSRGKFPEGFKTKGTLLFNN